MEKEENTFKKTSEYLVNNGWERINCKEYKKEKALMKNQTARLGIAHFFKLKKSNEEILKEQIR